VHDAVPARSRWLTADDNPEAARTAAEPVIVDEGEGAPARGRRRRHQALPPTSRPTTCPSRLAPTPSRWGSSAGVAPGGSRRLMRDAVGQ
jgi:hypothetical protein